MDVPYVNQCEFKVKNVMLISNSFFIVSTSAGLAGSDKTSKKKGWRPKRRVGGGSTSTSGASSSSHAEPDDSRSATLSKDYCLVIVSQVIEFLFWGGQN